MRLILNNRETWMRLGWVGFGYLIILGSRDLFLRGSGTGTGEFFGLFSGKWGIGLILFSIGAAVLLAFVIQAAIRPIAATENRLRKISAFGANIRWALIGLLILLPLLLFLGPWGWRFNLPNFRLFILIAVAFMSSVLLSKDDLENFWTNWVLLSLLATSLLLFGQRLSLVTDTPFPLSWSEGNRLWDYSLYFGRDRYTIVGEFSFPTYLAPGRHGLWGLPFLVFPGVTIMWMRVWDAFLWTFPYLIFGFVVFSKELENYPKNWRWGLALWASLFLTLGLIQAPLVLAASLFVWGFMPQKKWRTIAIIAAASFYAGISRWTWMVAPGIWAAMWSLLLTKKDQPFWDRLKNSFIFGFAGILGALGSVIFMDLAFPRPDAFFSTSLSQPLLWDRLWSNPTNPSGIVPALLHTAGPLVLLLLWAGIRKYFKLDALQSIVVSGILLVFLSVGLAASVKIGGGSNLHNMDMFLVTLVLLVGIVARQSPGMSGLPTNMRNMPAYGWGMAVLIGLMPLWILTRSYVPLEVPSAQLTREAMATIRAEVTEASKHGEVLLMDQRQLLTFGEITELPLVLDYELKHVMNQAMSQNRAYFQQFYVDLEHHRFSMIVSDPLHPIIQGDDKAFAEENNAWVEQVTLRMLKYYEPLLEINEIEVWLLVPKEVEEH